MRAARRSTRLTEFDGDLSGRHDRALRTAGLPSQLEAWAKCPHAYFVRYLLGVRRSTTRPTTSPSRRSNEATSCTTRSTASTTRSSTGQLPQPGARGLAAGPLDTPDRAVRRGRRRVRAHRPHRPCRTLVPRSPVGVDRTARTGSSATASPPPSAVSRSSAPSCGSGRDGSGHACRSPTVAGWPCAGRSIASTGAGPASSWSWTTRPAATVDFKTHRLPTTRPRAAPSSSCPIYAAAALAHVRRRCRPVDRPACWPSTTSSTAATTSATATRSTTTVWRRVADDLGTRRRHRVRACSPPSPARPKWQFRIDCHYCQPDGLGVDERFGEWNASSSIPRLAPVVRRRTSPPSSTRARRRERARPARPISADRRPHRHRSRHQPVRRGRRRCRQDQRASSVASWRSSASGVEIGTIAAITFTEKAAAELRHRLRAELTAAEPGSRPDHAERLHLALDALDHAPIGTLHAFARRILNDYPDARPVCRPGSACSTSSRASSRSRSAGSTLLDQILDDPDPPGGIVDGGSELIELCELDNFGCPSAAAGSPPGSTTTGTSSRPASTAPILPRGSSTRHRSLGRVLAVCDTPCPPDDTQAARLAELRLAAQQLGEADRLGEQIAILEHLEDRCRKVKRTGAKAKWKSAGLDPTSARRSAPTPDRARRSGAGAAAIGSRPSGRGARRAARTMGARCRPTPEPPTARVEFHDLLVLARRLVARHPAVRADLHRRYQRILLDEFQDTDPIQLEIAVRLAADPHDPAQHDDWHDCEPLPGRLFIVGDPKQSIYRFRRADIAQYLRAADADRRRHRPGCRPTSDRRGRCSTGSITCSPT